MPRYASIRYFADIFDIDYTLLVDRVQANERQIRFRRHDILLMS